MCNVVLALPAECWRWVPGYEGLYQVSTRGRVRSVGRWVTDKTGRKGFYKGRILKARQTKDGYLEVGLCLNGKQRNLKVHRMVLEVWGDGNPKNKPEVNHLDEDKTNNEVYNLAWVSHEENMNWGTGIKRGHDSLSKAVQALDPKTGEVVLEFPSTAEAGRKGFDNSAISKCCRGVKSYKTHKGYMWRYKE